MSRLARQVQTKSFLDYIFEEKLMGCITILTEISLQPTARHNSRNFFRKHKFETTIYKQDLNFW